MKKPKENVHSKYKRNPTGKGNIDLRDRPQYKNKDGSVSTVRSMSFNDGKHEVLIPTIGRDSKGKPVRWTDEQAIKHYKKTGEHLGKFKSVKEANAYAKQLHEDQDSHSRSRRNSHISIW